MRIHVFAGLVAAIAVTAAAAAGPNLEFSVGLCAAKTNAKARLACYDAIAAQLKVGAPVAAAAPVAPAPVAPIAAAPAAPPPVVAAPVAPPPVAPPPVAAAPVAPVAAAPAAAAPVIQTEAQFGAENLGKPERQAAGQPEEIDAIKGSIATLSYLPNGRALITLSNGQVWRQIDGDSEHFRGKNGELATVERGIFGSYNLTVEGHNQMIKVQRVR